MIVGKETQTFVSATNLTTEHKNNGEFVKDRKQFVVNFQQKKLPGVPGQPSANEP